MEDTAGQAGQGREDDDSHGDADAGEDVGPSVLASTCGRHRWSHRQALAHVGVGLAAKDHEGLEVEPVILGPRRLPRQRGARHLGPSAMGMGMAIRPAPGPKRTGGGPSKKDLPCGKPVTKSDEVKPPPPPPLPPLLLLLLLLQE